MMPSAAEASSVRSGLEVRNPLPTELQKTLQHAQTKPHKLGTIDSTHAAELRSPAVAIVALCQLLPTHTDAPMEVVQSLSFQRIETSDGGVWQRLKGTLDITYCSADGLQTWMFATQDERLEAWIDVAMSVMVI
jgi:hypothetical protein